MNNQDITIEELGKKLKEFELKISIWAKGGMREYTKDELMAYEASRLLIDFLESEGVNLARLNEYWDLFAPTEHKTIKATKPFTSKDNETEVFDIVKDRILNGENDIDDDNFIEEIERRSNGISLD